MQLFLQKYTMIMTVYDSVKIFFKKSSLKIPHSHFKNRDSLKNIFIN